MEKTVTTYEQAAIEVMKEDGEDLIWFGDPNVWHGIFKRKNGHNNRHPINQWKAVYAALIKSKKFFISGYIDSPGFTTSREIAHPVFKLKEGMGA